MVNFLAPLGAILVSNYLYSCGLGITAYSFFFGYYFLFYCITNVITYFSYWFDEDAKLNVTEEIAKVMLVSLSALMDLISYAVVALFLSLFMGTFQSALAWVCLAQATYLDIEHFVDKKPFKFNWENLE